MYFVFPVGKKGGSQRLKRITGPRKRIVWQSLHSNLFQAFLISHVDLCVLTLYVIAVSVLLWCFVFLQSRGEGLKSKENSGTKFFLLFKPSPWDWRKTKHQNVVLRVFHTLWHIFCVWKTVRTTFWRIVVSQSRGDRSKMWENFMDSGSQSETYIGFRQTKHVVCLC